METSEIQFSQIDDRMDAEYYRPEYINAIRKIEKSKAVLLNDRLTYITDGTHITPIYMEKGVKFLSSRQCR